MNEKKKIVEPIKFEVLKDGGIGIAKNVISFVHTTKDPRLVSFRIPGFVKDAEGLIRELENRLAEQDAKVGVISPEVVEPYPEKGQNLIMRPSSEKADSFNFIAKTQTAGFANFRLQPNYFERFLDCEGNEVEEKSAFDVTISFADLPSQKFRLPVAETSRILQIVQRKFPYADYDKSTPEIARAIESEFRAMTKRLPVLNVLRDYGWQLLGGKHLFVTDDMTYLPSGYTAKTSMHRGLRDERIDPLETITNLFRLTKDQQALSVLIAFSLLGSLFKLFEEAGHTPHFLLFITGKTGSMKTTIGKILFTQLQKNGEKGEPRRIDADTVTSFERAVVNAGRDTVLLIDDFAPQRTPSRAREMENRMEMLIRMVGDGATKSRSNAKLEDVKGKGVKGVVAVTGEIRAKGLSSNLRCCYCHLKREDVNPEIITWFQEQGSAFPQLIALFTEFLSTEWDGIVEYIRETFQLERRRIATIIMERRFVDSTVTLRIASDIWRWFLERYISGGDAEQVADVMKANILSNALANQEMVHEEPITTKVVKALNQMMVDKRICLCNRRPTYKDIALIDGFEDENFLYLIPEKVFVKLTDYYKRMNTNLGYDLPDLLETLADEGVIRTHKNGKKARVFGKRIDVGGGKKLQFIEIRKTIFEERLNGGCKNDD